MLDALPFERLLARIRAFPLVTDVAFRDGLIALEHGLDGEPLGTTCHLAAALEEDLRGLSAGASVEVLRQARAMCWRAGEAVHAGKLPLSTYLASVSGALIEHGAPTATIKASRADYPEAVLRWRLMSLQLPADLMVAAAASSSGQVPTADRVSLLSRQLRQMLLENPVAETHLHVGAGTAFCALWSGFMGQLATDPPRPKLLERGGTSPFRDGDETLRWVLVAAIARIIFASFIHHRMAGTGPRRLAQFLGVACEPGPGQAPIFQRITRRMTRAGSPGQVCATGLAALSALRRGSDPPHHATLRRWYAELVRHRSAIPGKHVDPLAVARRSERSDTFPETRLAAKVITLLLGDAKNDNTLAQLFWQYQRVRCRIYQWLVEQPETAGLDWFSRHYDRIKAVRPKDFRDVIGGAWRTEAADLHLGSLEIRTAPEDTPSKVRDQVADLAVAVSQLNGRLANPLEAGLVLHLVKARSGAVAVRGRMDRRLHADPGIPGLRCRYARWFLDWEGRARAMATAIERWPSLLLFLRGIDIANLELAVPTWAYLPILSRLRQVSVKVSHRFGLELPDWKIRGLGCTLHVGEDYRRLMEGLRRIHEPIEFGLLVREDRIGHGLALGHDPERWCRAFPCVPQPREERLDDLLWELDRYDAGDFRPTPGRVHRVRGMVRELAGVLYGESSPEVDRLQRARRWLHEPHRLRYLNYPYMAHIRKKDVEMTKCPVQGLVLRRLMDVGVFRRGLVPVKVEVDDDERAVLKRAQHWLRGEVERREITVESNPSSNLVIGDMSSLGHHPSFRLSPPRGAAECGPSVLVSVNSDDPVTFATCLADEYAYAYGGLVASGLDVDNVLAWLEHARKVGWRSRFTLHTSARGDAIKNMLHRLGRGSTLAAHEGIFDR